MTNSQQPVSSPPLFGGEDQGEGAVTFARALREQSTWAECKLWSLLRARRFAGHKFRRQHPCGIYTLDFYCAGKRLAIELDGDVHGTPEQQAHDAAKDQYLRSQKIRVLRFWNLELLENQEGVLQTIQAALMMNGVNPHPDPLPYTAREKGNN
jgi:very-short-patch-repair endonuclease